MWTTVDLVIARTIPRVAEQRRRRVRAGERHVVANVDPGPPGIGLALGQHRHGRIVAVQTLRSHHVGLDKLVQRLRCYGARTHLVGQGRDAEIDPFPGVAVPLPVQGLCAPYFSKRIVASRLGPGQSLGTAPAVGKWSPTPGR